jgi:glycogen debranching enzyme
LFQGPEWVWPVGFFLRAAITFHYSGSSSTSSSNLVVPEGKENEGLVKYIFGLLGAHSDQLKTSPWHGLVELTNKDGVRCDASCDTQAWSSACLLDALYQLRATTGGKDLKDGGEALFCRR